MNVTRYTVEADTPYAVLYERKSAVGEYVKQEDYAALEQRLIESERYGRQTDITIDNLEMKLAQMAAENAGLKAAKEIIRHLNANREEANFCGIDDCYIDDAVAAMITPATSAFLAEVRAQGVDALVERRLTAARLAKEAGHEITARDLEGEAIRARFFAMEIRKGVQS